MQKLNEIRWIIREKGCSTKAIAEVQHITVQRVNQMYKQYRVTGEASELKNAGRPKRQLKIMVFNT